MRQTPRNGTRGSKFGSALRRSAANAGALAWIAAAPMAYACDDDDANGPDIGLVLSGGGALASSQVGAIKALEEAGVPIHCIVGTSMGAVVGALYASGYSADELTNIFVDADWGAISTGAMSYREQGFRAKEDQSEFFSDYVVGVGKNGLVLPTGISSLRGMKRYLRQQTDALGQEVDFDKLPIPFRAIATDLSTGDSVTLGRGDLVSAALASMAVPGLYPSQRIDGRTLIDGGMSKQVPIDVAREMGADIIIVVDTTLPPGNFDDGSPSAFEAIMQLVNLQVWRNREVQIKQLTPQDLLIVPDLTGYSTTSFDRLDEGFEAGRAAARLNADRLRVLAATAAPSVSRVRMPKDEILISTVTVSEHSGTSEALILERLAIAPGQTVTRENIHDGVEDVAALGVFDTVDYRLTPGPAGQSLELSTTANGPGNQHIQLGTKLSATFDGDSTYALLGRWSLKPLNAYAGELNITGEIGTDFGADVEWVQPVGPAGRFFVETGAGYYRRTVPINVDETRVAERRDETSSVRLLVGQEFGDWGIASVGAVALDLNSDIRVGTTLGLGTQSGTYVGLAGHLAADTLNSPSFPTRGFAGDLSAIQYSNVDDDTEATMQTLSFSVAGALGGLGTFLRYDGGRMDGDALHLPTFKLGGFKQLSGFEDNSVPATAYHLLRLETFTRLGAELEASFGVPVFVGATLEAAQVEFGFDANQAEGEFYAGSVYSAVNTPLGPAYLALGLGEEGRKSFYVYFGRAF